MQVESFARSLALDSAGARIAASIAIMAITHCQIFEGINKVITITPSPDKKINKALCEKRIEIPHSECLEDFKIKI